MMWQNLLIQLNTKKSVKIQKIFFIVLLFLSHSLCVRKYTRENIRALREEVREMFQHAYDSYLKYASDYDELRPLSCDGVDTWGSYSLTLIDSLDTLAVMGNFTEFRRVVDILIKKSNFDSDINVSVFETNIRILGGLISGHLLQHRSGAELEPGWPCNGPLLQLAEDVAKRLLPAFDTRTGMPYGTVNLKYGVPENETSITCAACIGTFIVEFGALSRLTGDPIYETVALNAIHSLYRHKSHLGLYGNHIDVQTGRWTGVDSGIGAGIDSYYEYLVKGSIMLNRPELLDIFNEGKIAIDKYLNKNDWHVWVSMTKGQVTLPVFQSLDAYWPGVLSMLGDIPNAMKSIYNYHSVWKQYGFLPEFYNIPNTEAGTNRESYPLRPEFIESIMYLYRATGDSYLLEVGEDVIRSIQNSAKTACGYATIKNVRDHRKENRMESFFLAETTKYLYLLFDPDHYLNNDGGIGTVINTPNGECVIDAGGYIFNTEAHPIDPLALRCCHDVPKQQLLSNDFNPTKYMGDVFRINMDIENDVLEYPVVNQTYVEDLNITNEITRLTNLTSFSVDQLFSTDEAKTELLKFLKEMETSSEKKEKQKDDNKRNEVDDDLVLRHQIEKEIEKEIAKAISEKSSKRDGSVLKNKEKDKGNSEASNIGNVTTSPKQENNDEITSIPVKKSDVEHYRETEFEPKVITNTTVSNDSDNISLNRNRIVPPPPPTITPRQQSEPFDIQRLMQRINTMYNDQNITRNYEILSCPAQSYSQRLAVLGEIIT